MLKGCLQHYALITDSAKLIRQYIFMYVEWSSADAWLEAMVVRAPHVLALVQLSSKVDEGYGLPTNKSSSNDCFQLDQPSELSKCDVC